MHLLSSMAFVFISLIFGASLINALSEDTQRKYEPLDESDVEIIKDDQYPEYVCTDEESAPSVCCCLCQ